MCVYVCLFLEKKMNPAARAPRTSLKPRNLPADLWEFPRLGC